MVIGKFNNNKVIKPNFLGIGAPKCGTTWSYEVLRRHPEIFVAHGKELVYFSSHKKYSLGEDWYLSHFKNARSFKAIGEISVSYFTHEAATERIYKFDPKIKMFLFVRDPVGRAFSHYRWLLQKGKSMPPFLDALHTVPELKNGSMYYANLSRILECFEINQILILKYDDIMHNVSGLQYRLFDFLDVDTQYTYNVGRVGATINPRFKQLEKLRIYLHTQARIHGIPQVITLGKRFGISNFYRKINNNTRNKIAISQTEQEAGFAIFENDLLKFQELTGIDVADWLNGKKG